MIVRDIYAEVKQATGQSSEALNLKAVTRAVRLLSNSGLIDPLIGTINATVAFGHLVVLPREVKTVLKVNIDNNPSFFRNRAFEFLLNTDGTEAGDGVGWNWSDRGFSPIQIPGFEPGPIGYLTGNSVDNGKTLKVFGRDANGREINATLTGHDTDPVKSAADFHEITRVQRTATVYGATLTCGEDDVLVAQYYADETSPNYRVIRLSKTAVTARILFVRHTFNITSQDDFIPIANEEAVICACKAVQLRAQDEYAAAALAEAAAIKLLTDEQASLNRAMEAAQGDENGATDYGINVRDSVVAGDVYDTACQIFGKIGRRKIFDKITAAIEVLRNEAFWDAELGVVDIWPPDRTEDVNRKGGEGVAFFTLPRFVETVLSLNQNGAQGRPRNGWFEFHLNGSGEEEKADSGAWDHAGETVLITEIPRAPDTGYYVPTAFVAVPDLQGDNDTLLTIYGKERLADGRDAEVYRNGVRGWACPCRADSVNPGANYPLFTEVTRIVKAESTGFIRLVSLSVTPAIPEVVAVPEQTLPSVMTLTHAAGIPGLNRIPTVTGGDILFEQDGVGEDKTFYFLGLGDDGGVTQFHLYEIQANGSALDIFSVSQNISESNTVHTSIGDFTVPDTFFEEGAISILKLVVTHQVIIPAIPYQAEIPAVFEENKLYGYYYPDETEPKYLRVKLSSFKARMIRVLYRKRFSKITGLFDPIPLRSRLALETALRSLKIGETDPVAAVQSVAIAVGYLNKEKLNWTPNDKGSLQFDSAVMAGNSFNIS